MHKIKFEGSDYYFRIPFDNYFYTKANKLMSNAELEKKGIYQRLVNKVHKEIENLQKPKSIPESISEYILVNNSTPTFDACKSILSSLKTNYTHLSISEIVDKIVSLNLANYSMNNLKVITDKKINLVQKYLVSKNNNEYLLSVPKCHTYKLINQLIRLDNTLKYEIG